MGCEMETSIFKNILTRTAHQNWETALFLFALIALFLFAGVFLKSFNFFFMGMLLYFVFSLIFVKREYWKEIRIRKPAHPIYILWGIILGLLVILTNYLITYLTSFNPLNSMVVEAELQLSYSGITKYNAWQYFPASALGFCILSPLTEELFFRGFLLKSFENKFSALFANLFQSLLFGIIALAYFWLAYLEFFLVFTTVPLVSIGGFINGWIAQRTNSVFASMIAYSFDNFIDLLIVFAFIIPAIG